MWHSAAGAAVFDFLAYLVLSTSSSPYHEALDFLELLIYLHHDLLFYCTQSSQPVLQLPHNICRFNAKAVGSVISHVLHVAQSRLNLGELSPLLLLGVLEDL